MFISARSHATLVPIACLIAAGIAAGCGEAPPAADPDSRRTPATGEVLGFVGEYGSHVWQGIPYAKPPLGELRWRAP